VAIRLSFAKERAARADAQASPARALMAIRAPIRPLARAFERKLSIVLTAFARFTNERGANRSAPPRIIRIVVSDRPA